MDEQYEKSKNQVAKGLDKLFESIVKKKQEPSQADVMNMLPKPNSQEFGDGVIVWRWHVNEIVIESVLATREDNQSNLPGNTYVVALQMPESENYMWSLFDDTAAEIGKTLLSAWNWQHIWKTYAGDFILEEMAKAPTVPTVNDVVTNSIYCNGCGNAFTQNEYHKCLRENHAQ